VFYNKASKIFLNAAKLKSITKWIQLIRTSFKIDFDQKKLSIKIQASFKLSIQLGVNQNVYVNVYSSCDQVQYFALNKIHVICTGR